MMKVSAVIFHLKERRLTRCATELVEGAMASVLRPAACARVGAWLELQSLPFA